MPRPKRKSGAADFGAPPHKLSSAAREEIMLALGLVPPSADETELTSDIFHQIEKWLGWYKEASSASAKLPGPTDYKRELQSFEEDIREFSEKMLKYPDWVKERINQQGEDLANLEESLMGLAGACATAASEYVKQGGLGRKKDQERLEVIKKLRRVFLAHYTDGKYDLSPAKLEMQKKDAEHDFVKIALKDAGISAPKDLARLIKAPESALPQERAEVRKRISKRAEKEAGKVDPARRKT